MQLFDISWMAIFKIVAAGAFSYVVLPVLLVVRDLLLHKAIRYWILTEKLTLLISMCENDRWFLNNKYNSSIKVISGNESVVYKIDDREVTREQFSEYEKGRNFHLNRFEIADSKLVMKHNLITWLTRHYKQADGGNPIPDLRKKYYASAGAREV
jgi:hypothetical protein